MFVLAEGPLALATLRSLSSLCKSILMVKRNLGDDDYLEFIEEFSKRMRLTEPPPDDQDIDAAHDIDAGEFAADHDIDAEEVAEDYDIDAEELVPDQDQWVDHWVLWEGSWWCWWGNVNLFWTWDGRQWWNYQDWTSGTW